MCALLPVRELATERATPRGKLVVNGYPTQKGCTATKDKRLTLKKFNKKQAKIMNLNNWQPNRSLRKAVSHN